MYSAWLRPPEPLRAILYETILKTSRKYGSQYTFDPHVTLLSRSDIQDNCLKIIESKMGQICEKLTPIRLTLNQIDYNPNGAHYNSAFLAGSNEVNIDFQNAKQLCRQFFLINPNQPPKTMQLAHLALLYFDNDTPQNNKALEQSVIDIKSELIRHNLWDNESEGITFVANNVEMWYTPPHVNEWHFVKNFNFKHNSKM